MASESDKGIRAYKMARCAVGRRNTMVGCLLGVVLIPLFGVYDFFSYPREFPILIAARIACMVLIAGVYLGLRGRPGERHPDWLALLLGGGIGVGLCAVPVWLFGFDSTYYAAAIIEIAVFAILVLWSAVQVGILSATVVGLYVAAALLHGDIGDLPMFVGQTGALLAVGALAVAGLLVQERVRLREFLSRRALQAVAAEKSRLVDELQQKAAELEHLNQDMEDLLYVTSHDLRAPLINIQGFAQEIKAGLAELRSRGEVGPETQVLHDDLDESMHFILTAAARMDGLIQALLDVSRINTRTDPSEPVALQPLVEGVIASFRHQLQERAIGVRIGELPDVVGDSIRLGQVFGNLIENAIKYMGDAPQRAIEIGSCRQNGMVKLFVRDTGPGIPARDHETVFRMFRRLGSSVPGEGLGLGMVRKVVEKHGGAIWVDSRPGDGSTFWFTLPAGAGDESQPAAGRGRKEIANGRDSEGDFNSAR